jgi:hypothetical protein
MESNPYLSLKIDESDILPIVRSVAKILDQLDIVYKLSNRFHISLAYVIGDHKKEEFYDVLKEIAEAEIIVRPIGIELLEGQTTPYDYLSLKLNQPDDFEYAKGLIKENFKIKENFGGTTFSPHISLAILDKTETAKLSKEDRDYLCRYIEILILDQAYRCKINSEEIELYSRDYKKLDSKKINKKRGRD